jgi:putative ABC transport system permease protein
MRLSRIIWKELWHRKVGALVVLVGIVLCVGTVVAIQRLSSGAVRDIRRIMHGMGKNLIILPRGVTLDDYWAGRFGDRTLPQTDVGMLAKYAAEGGVPVGHIRGSLQRRIELKIPEGPGRIRKEPIILCGLMDENPGAAEAASEPFSLESGKVEVGHRIAERLDLRKGDPFPPLPNQPPMRMRTVRRVREETGTAEDFKVFVDIGVAQNVLKAGKVINVIEAMTEVSAVDRLEEVTRKIQRRLTAEGETGPGVDVYHLVGLAKGRAKARTSASRNAALLGGLALICGALIIAGYSVLNARERRREMGILLAVAARPKHLAWLFLGKMCTLGVIGGLLGCALGDGLATRLGPPVVAALRPNLWNLYGGAVLVALMLTVLPGLVGVLLVTRVDPAQTLREG